MSPARPRPPVYMTETIGLGMGNALNDPKVTEEQWLAADLHLAETKNERHHDRALKLQVQRERF